MERITHITDKFKLIVDIYARRVCIELFKLEKLMYVNVFQCSFKAITDGDKQAGVQLFAMPLWLTYRFHLPDIPELWKTKTIINND